MFSVEVWREVWVKLLSFMPVAATSLAIFFGFWIAAVLASRVIGRLRALRGVDPSLVSFLGRVAEIGLLLFGTVSALGTLGIDVSVLVAGVGLTGFALGFALKDIVSNLLAGILVIIYKPFDLDDSISVSSYQGTVVEINLRYTTLQADGKKIYIPNAMVFSNAVTVEG